MYQGVVVVVGCDILHGDFWMNSVRWPAFVCDTDRNHYCQSYHTLITLKMLEYRDVRQAQGERVRLD